MYDRIKLVYEYRYFQLAYFKNRTHANDCSDFISVRYTITDLQLTETL